MRPLARRTVLLSALAAPAVARAQSFPNRPIKLVIPWPPGASADAFALLERFEAKLKDFQANVPRAATELAKDWRMPYHV